MASHNPGTVYVRSVFEADVPSPVQSNLYPTSIIVSGDAEWKESDNYNGKYPYLELTGGKCQLPFIDINGNNPFTLCIGVSTTELTGADPAILFSAGDDPDNCFVIVWNMCGDTPTEGNISFYRQFNQATETYSGFYVSCYVAAMDAMDVFVIIYDGTNLYNDTDGNGLSILSYNSGGAALWSQLSFTPFGTNGPLNLPRCHWYVGNNGLITGIDGMSCAVTNVLLYSRAVTMAEGSSIYNNIVDSTANWWD